MIIRPVKNTPRLMSSTVVSFSSIARKRPRPWRLRKTTRREALDAIRDGLEQLRAFFAAYDAEEHMEEDGMVQQLRKMDRSLRKLHNIEATLQERLAEAVANEQYETAAQLRDALRRRQQ